MTERDLALLKALARYRYMRTSQIKRLIFAKNKTLQPTRRRLRHLHNAGYVDHLESLISSSTPNPEQAHYLLRKGIEAITAENEELPNYAHSKQVKHAFLSHALDVSEWRLITELATQSHALLRLQRFIADHELKSNLQKLNGQHRYRLFHQVKHPIGPDLYTVYPDALMILSGRGDHSDKKRLYLVEIDRATEGLRVIRNKVIGYHLFRKAKLHAKWGVPEDFRVLIQTTSQRRAQNICEDLVETSGSDLVWVTHHAAVNVKTLLAEPIWKDVHGKPQSLLRQNSQDKSVS